MRASEKTYKDVANRCSEFQSVYGTDIYRSMYSDGPAESCTNCKNFSDNKYCELNLYDQIVQNHRL